MAATSLQALRRAPAAEIESLAELVGTAHALEMEAIRRYRWLAVEMRRREQPATANAFEILAEEEGGHLTAIQDRARELGESVSVVDFRWRLPKDLAESWEGAVGSALLTPYRAYAIAIDNEQRAFAFYSHLAAAARDPSVAREAQRLASDELQHAARLRTLRRAAWRQEIAQAGRQPSGCQRPRTPEELARLLIELEAEIAACHGLLAERLRQLGDLESAALLEESAAEAASRAAAGGTAVRVDGTAEECKAKRRLGLLLAAQRPLESLCELLEELHLGAPNEAMQAMSETFLIDAVGRVARLGRRIEALEKS